MRAFLIRRVSSRRRQRGSRWYVGRSTQGGEHSNEEVMGRETQGELAFGRRLDTLENIAVENV